MISIQGISLEYKSTALFAALALLFSLVIGFAAGIRWSVVLLRSLVLVAVFAAIGYGICFVMKKFVPEVYGYLAGIAGAAEAPEAAGAEIDMTEPEAGTAAGGEAGMADMAGGGEVAPAVASSPGEFTELEKEGLEHYSTAPGATPVNTRGGKLGKHILEKEKIAKYEPKIMAQAVRTMMSKDRE